MEEEIYEVLRKHKLPLKKREELIADLLPLFKPKVCDHLYDEYTNEFNKTIEVCALCGQRN